MNREQLLNRRRRLYIQPAPPTQQPANRLRSMDFLVRSGFLGIVLITLFGVWSVISAHLTEQFLGAQQPRAGLIGKESGQGALTPEYIEREILRFNLRLREDELTIPYGSSPAQRPFVIEPGEAARFVALRLQEEGFVHDADLFNLYLRVNGLERRINSGNFILTENMTVPQIADALQRSLSPEAVVTIPEGFRIEEIVERLIQNNVVTDPEAFLRAVRTPRNLSIYNDYEFLQFLPEGASLEGFLFPDTYRLPVFASSMELIIQPFLDNFERKVSMEELTTGSGGLRGRDLITVASIVEREAVQADERPLIASVYINRLNNVCPDVGGRWLQADPTVQYAKGVAGNWWWKPTDISEYKTIVSPYNTYLNEGLPPGPIANPGLSAIESTRTPAATGYCFFVGTNEDGRHVFAVTLAEQEQNIRTYQGP